MKYSDLKLLSNVCYAVGILSLLFGIIAFISLTRIFERLDPIHYAFPLVFIGFVFLMIGYVVMELAKEEEKD